MAASTPLRQGDEITVGGQVVGHVVVSTQHDPIEMHGMGMAKQFIQGAACTTMEMTLRMARNPLPYWHKQVGRINDAEIANCQPKTLLLSGIDGHVVEGSNPEEYEVSLTFDFNPDGHDSLLYGVSDFAGYQETPQDIVRRVIAEIREGKHDHAL